MDTAWRSWLKAVSWRVLASLVTLVVAYWWTGEIVLALGIGGLDTLVKIGLYFIHERAWARIAVGVRRVTLRGQAAA